MILRGLLIIIGIVSLLAFIFLILKDRKEPTIENILYDYNKYPMSEGEKIKYILFAAAILYLVGYIFYQSKVGGLLLTPFAVFYPKMKTKEKIEGQKKQLSLEFKETLYILSSSLAVGKSLESAIKDSIRELETLYPGNNTFIVKELEYIVRKIEMNETVEEAFATFAKRSHMEEIENFVEVLITCKRAGGNLVEVMGNTFKMITEKIDFQQELDLILTKRRFEQKLLTIIPVALVLILSWSAPDYMEPVFNSLLGRIIMTLAIGLFALSMVITKKLIKIEV